MFASPGRAGLTGLAGLAGRTQRPAGGPHRLAGRTQRLGGKTRGPARHQPGVDTGWTHRSIGDPRSGSTRSQGRPPDLAAWRHRQLLSAGFPDDLARTLAEEPGVDLHALLQLVDRGCPAELAARILAPIPDPDSPS